MQDRKLEQALEFYFERKSGEDNKDGKDTKDVQDREKYQNTEKYLKLRIRPAMEFLIEKEDTEKMEQLEKCGWFSAKELDVFIRCAQEKEKLRSLVWLLHLKNEKYGYQKKDFSL